VPRHNEHVHFAMILQLLRAPVRPPLRLAGLTVWLLGVVQSRAEGRAASPVPRNVPPTKPEFVDTEASWHVP
jgi:hypothetical protein